MAQPERLPEAPTPVAPPEVTPWHEAPELNGISAVRLGQPQAKRVRTSDAANDIENAFTAWHAYAYDLSHDRDANEAEEAKTRVLTWLTQVTADQRQLHAALLACQALDEANDDVDVRRATALARIALETK